MKHISETWQKEQSKKYKMIKKASPYDQEAVSKAEWLVSGGQWICLTHESYSILLKRV